MTFETNSPPAENWLDLDQIAQVAVTSEDPDYPIESALTDIAPSGWRAAERGEQTIRLAFQPPQRIKRIMLRFVETEAERTQEFSLRWRDQRGREHEIVRQQWNFSPLSAPTEVEDYAVELDGVETLELNINPDISHRAFVAKLAEWRVA